MGGLIDGKREDLAIRVRTVQKLGFSFPPTAQLLLNWAHAHRPQSQILSFAVPVLPPTVNHMYLPGRPGQRRLSPEAIQFRRTVSEAIGSERRWRPVGSLLSIIFYASPYWITKERTMRTMDVDNRQKALFDAVGRATDVNDCRFWEYHAYKIVSPQVQTSVYVVDMGDIVEVYK